MKKIILVIFLVLAGIGAFFLIKLGAFRNVNFEVKTAGPFNVIYQEHIGPYHKIGPLVQEAQKFAASLNIPCQGFGEFLDDPSKVEHIRLRSNAGCVLQSEPTVGLPVTLKQKTIPARQFLTAEFDGTPAFGPIKVYGDVGDYLYKNKLQLDGATLEIYQDLPDGLVKTKYYFPVKAAP
ncbi:MAG: GyrI-like domain-containing protein [Bdellovibrionota bacterium]